MSHEMDEQENIRYQAAKERVEELRGFYMHLASYVIVNLFLFALNMVTDRGNLWFYWPLLGWGIGLAVHAASVFILGGGIGQSWEQRKIAELMEKDRRK